MSAENPTDSSPLYASYFYFTKTTPLQINHEPLKTDHLRALTSVQLQFDTLKTKTNRTLETPLKISVLEKELKFKR